MAANFDPFALASAFAGSAPMSIDESAQSYFLSCAVLRSSIVRVALSMATP